jgi:hypothetical protein
MKNNNETIERLGENIEKLKEIDFKIFNADGKGIIKIPELQYILSNIEDIYIILAKCSDKFLKYNSDVLGVANQLKAVIDNMIHTFSQPYGDISQNGAMQVVSKISSNYKNAIENATGVMNKVLFHVNTNELSTNDKEIRNLIEELITPTTEKVALVQSRLDKTDKIKEIETEIQDTLSLKKNFWYVSTGASILFLLTSLIWYITCSPELSIYQHIARLVLSFVFLSFAFMGINSINKLYNYELLKQQRAENLKELRNWMGASYSDKDYIQYLIQLYAEETAKPINPALSQGRNPQNISLDKLLDLIIKKS